MNVLGSNINSYLTITFISTDGSSTETSVDIFIGKKYKFSYIGENNEFIKDKIGIVTTIGTQAIGFKVLELKDGHPCICIENSKAIDNVDVKTIYVAPDHLLSIKEYVEPKPAHPRPKERNVVAVALLGISAELIHSIVVRLRFYDDKCYTSEANTVNMEVGKTYHVTYTEHDPQHTTFELVGKLLKISMEETGVKETEHGFIRDEIPQECIGMDNKVYNSDHFMQLPKYGDINLADRIAFTFDTSIRFGDQKDVLLLRDIRNVEEIDEVSDEPDNSDDCNIDPDFTFPGVQPPYPYPPHCPPFQKPWAPHCHWSPPYEPGDVPHHPLDPSNPNHPFLRPPYEPGDVPPYDFGPTCDCNPTKTKE